MIIPLAGLIALLSPLAFGGRLGRYAEVRIRSGWLVFAALAAQVLVIEVVPDGDRVVLSAVHLATYAVAGLFVWRNRDVPGLWILALGAASNGVTIALNGGTLPASADAVRHAGLALESEEFLNSGVLENPRLPWLGDVFWIPDGWPMANVFSIGDVLIVLGIGWGAHRVAGSRLVPARWHWAPPTAQQPRPDQPADTPEQPADTPEVPAAVAFLPAPVGEALE
ncbi:MAG TPA: DUF5317 domain-containing protein [Lapillicoccus sp.]|nr:DUF5317 domain-containing protein [Lapillicoccus sp.]